MDIETMDNFMLKGDNEISITLIKNVESQYCTKHIDVQNYNFREIVNKKEFTIEWILSANILANSFIKALSTEVFRKY